MPKRILRFLQRSGHEVTVADSLGQTHHATLSRVDGPAPVRENGSFSFGYCKSCEWVGVARRARSKARTDAIAHGATCPGKGSVRIGISEN